VTVSIANPPAAPGALQAQATANLTYSVAVPAAPTTGGAGCSAQNPIVTFSSGAATATATINSANVVTALTIKNAGAGYTTVPTPVFTNLHCTTAPTFTATLTNGVVASFNITNPGAGYVSVPAVTITSVGGGSGATATAGITFVPPVVLQTPTTALQANNTSMDVVGCIQGQPGSPLKTYNYKFGLATPTVLDNATAPGTPVVATSTVALDDPLVLSTTSNFTAPAAPSICYTTNGMAPNATCLAGNGTTCGASPLAVPATAANFATNTLMAIACDPASTTAQTNSAPYAAALNVVVGTPNPSVAGGTYYNTQSPTLTSSTTSGAPVICYSTQAAAAPTCNAGGCTGGTPVYTAGLHIPVTQTGTVIKAVACEGPYTSAVSTNTYVLNVSPIILSNDPVLPLSYTNTPPNCGGVHSEIDVGLDCSEGTAGGSPGCSTATFNAGGATTGAMAQVCYTTNGSAVTNCNPPGAGSPITCTAANTLFAAAMPTDTLGFTINALACAPGFNNSSATLTVTVAGYAAAASSTIAFTGAPATDFVVAPTNEDQLPPNNGTHGYVSLDGSKLYIGFDGLTPAATTDAVFYIGGTGAPTPPPPATTSSPAGTGTETLDGAAGFQYAIQFPTTGTTATLFAWNSALPGWVAQATGAPTVTVNAGMTAVELAVPFAGLTQIGGSKFITVLGAQVPTAGSATAHPNAVFPAQTWAAGVPAHWLAYPVGSCLYPNDPLAIH
jgi:hypothetical protein